MTTTNDERRLALIAAALVVCWLPVLLDRGAIAEVASLHGLAGGERPYFVPAHALLLYARAPLAAVSATVLVWSPGLLLALAYGRAHSAARWLLNGLAFSLVAVAVPTQAVEALRGAPLRGDPFALLLVGLSAACAIAAWLGVRRSASLAHGGTGDARTGASSGPDVTLPYDRYLLLGCVAAPLVLVAALTPKFYWEAFNGDGAHAFEAARLLLFQTLPFWPAEAGEVAGFPGLTSFLFLYPTSWFIRLFGEIEAAARLPYLLTLIALFAALVTAIDARTSPRAAASARAGSGTGARTGHGAGARTGAADWVVLWLGLALYSVVLAYSATYSPYSADIALPAVQDTLLVVWFLACVIAFFRAEWSWATAFAALTFVSLPNGIVLLGLLLVAMALVARDIGRVALARGAPILVGLVAASALLPVVLGWLAAPAPGKEYGLLNLVTRFAVLQFGDVQRFLYWVVPAGILPALSLLAWRRQDTLARTLTLVTAGYFLFTFVQYATSLHYYVPAMVLPLVVHWRVLLRWSGARRALLGSTAGAMLVALVLSLPEDGRPFTTPRQLGAAIEPDIAGYDRLEPEPMRASTLLRHVFPYDWDSAVPGAALGGSPLVWNYYAHERTKTLPANYLLTRDSTPPPAGARRVAAEDGFAVYVMDAALWTKQLALRPSTPAGSRIYHVSRGALFGSRSGERRILVLDLPALAERLGIDVDRLARRLGAKRSGDP